MTNMNLKCIDFFAGIGAWEIAALMVNLISPVKLETIEFIEINPQAQKVLRSHFPDIPIHDDVRSYKPKLREEVDVYFCSFPCTNTSAAGKKEGLAGSESNLWFESFRCITIGRPKFVIIEQPAGIIDRGLRAILGALRVAGYQAEIEVISASELGAPHERKRVFVIAYLHDLSLRQREEFCRWSEQIGGHVEAAKSLVPHPETQPGSLRLDDAIPRWLDGIRFDGWWLRHQPQTAGIDRTRSVSARRECINLYGRSIVPLQAAVALMRVQFLASLKVLH